VNAEDRPVEERRRGEDRRKLYGKPFLAMLAGALPEDRRKGERRKSSGQSTEQSAESVPTIRGDDDTPR
jgi:hypothetical protein